MDNYKHFIAGVSNVLLGVVHIITVKNDDVMPQVARFVKLVDAVKYEDGYYHTYYDEMKAVVKSYIIYWRETMELAIKQADCLCHKAEEGVDKDVFVLDVVNTISLWQDYENKFYREFLPIECAQQQKIYDDLNNNFKEHMKLLQEMKLQLEKFDRKELVQAFAKEQYAKSVESKEKVFLYTHDYLSMLLADHLPEIRGSLKEILNHTRNNLKQLENDRKASVNDLINKLYDKNKEQLMYTRRKCGSHCQSTEVHLEASEIKRLAVDRVLTNVERNLSFIKLGNDIQKIRTEVLNSGNGDPIQKVTEKLEVFKKRYAEFERIAKSLYTLKAELEKTYKDEAIYNSMITTELPGAKHWCWQNMGRNFSTRKEELKQLLLKASKALTTFFVVKSATEERICYKDIGKYSVDKFGHLVYHFDHGLNKYHLDCEGNLWKPDPKVAEYRDEIGRYVLKNNEKVYQESDCASLFKIGEDTLLEKISPDCGHSETTKRDCAVGLKYGTADVILPDAQPIDIRSKLKPETVKYLWDSVGFILPDALYDVYQQQPKNPIHYLAHSLLKHKYSKTPEELLRKKHESELYRTKILEERKEKVIAETEAWKAKQVQRRKPEESDDSYNRAVHDAYVATNQFIISLDNYD